ncbi:MAG: Lrp/AsnC family transcriptional regulator [Archaeoglobaceae archaeon]
MFDPEKKKILMALQYDLPLTENPFADLVDKTNLDQDFVFDAIRKFKQEGVIKRIGADLNYRSLKLTGKAALVGASVEENRVEDVATLINGINPKHNFWRQDDLYNVWFTIKARSEEEVVENTHELMKRSGVKNYVILPTRRVYKMDVKYDLYKGISWSNKGEEPEKVPYIDDLGLEVDLLKQLGDLPVEESPFKRLGGYGYSEGEIVDLIDELVGKGVFRDFSGVLSERKIGIEENGMTVIKPGKDISKIISQLLDNVPQITHLVERKIIGNWEYPIYFMVHAVNKEPIEEIKENVKQFEGVEDAKILYSKMDLKNMGK